jgi:hypothetical protein
MNKVTRKKRYSSPDEVIRSLSTKNDVRIVSAKDGNQIVRVLSNSARGRKNDLGNSSLGKIDYLTNHCGNKFTKQIVDKFEPKKPFKKKYPTTR